MEAFILDACMSSQLGIEQMCLAETVMLSPLVPRLPPGSKPFSMAMWHLLTAKWTRPVGRWVRLLLLISGDVENLGPLPREYQPRGELDLFGGLSRATPDVRSGLGDRRDGQFDSPSVWANAMRLCVAQVSAGLYYHSSAALAA